MRILFLGETFRAGREALAAALPGDEVGACPASSAREAMRGADVVVPAAVRLDGALMDAGPPRLIHQFGSGVDRVDLAAAEARGIPVARVPAGATGNAAAVAEVAVLHLLTLARRVRDARASIASGLVGAPPGHSLAGRRAVVVGMGGVGTATARLLVALGMHVDGVGRQAGPVAPGAPFASRAGVDALPAVLEGADAVVLCCPLDDRTRGLIGRRELGALRRGGWLVNVARGPVVDRDALLAALRSGQLGGAGLDVFAEEPVDPADPLLGEHVSATPHIAGVTHEVNAMIAQRFAANVDRLRRGEPLEHRVV